MAMFTPDMLGFGSLAALAALGAAMMLLMLAIGIAVYVYYALAYSTIARKLKHKQPWLAWIPFANLSLILMLGGFHWAYVFLMLVPILGWIALAVLGVISLWRIYEKRHYPGALALVPLGGFIPIVGWLVGIANIIIIGFVAWKDRK
jgi:hypothetical protein